MKKVRLWQLAVDSSESMAARKFRVLAQLPAILDSADYVGLPELWLSGAFNLQEIPPSADLVDAEFLDRLQSLVDASGCELHAGTFPIAISSTQFYNTAYFFRPQQPVIQYRKQHLFGFDDGERTLMQDSADLVVSESSLGKLAQTICYDLRFPELFRTLVNNQAEVFSIPAGWPQTRIEHWEVLIRARAIENQAFVLAVNAVGNHAGVEMGGRTAVVDPNGVAVFASANVEEVLEVMIEPAAVSIRRQEFPVLNDRKIK